MSLHDPKDSLSVEAGICRQAGRASRSHRADPPQEPAPSNSGDLVVGAILCPGRASQIRLAAPLVRGFVRKRHLSCLLESQQAAEHMVVPSEDPRRKASSRILESRSSRPSTGRFDANPECSNLLRNGGTQERGPGHPSGASFLHPSYRGPDRPADRECRHERDANGSAIGCRCPGPSRWLARQWPQTHRDRVSFAGRRRDVAVATRQRGPRHGRTGEGLRRPARRGALTQRTSRLRHHRRRLGSSSLQPRILRKRPHGVFSRAGSFCGASSP